MKYYLGYYGNQGYKPIKSEEIGTNLKELVDFTTSFPDTNSLREYLYQKKLIPSKHCSLYYLIEKGPKDAREYKAITFSSKIYTKESNRFFDTENIREIILKESDNYEFIIYLISRYLKRFGYLGIIKNHLYFATDEELINIFESTNRFSLSAETKKCLDDLTEYLNSGSESISRLEELLEKFIDAFTSNIYDTYNIFILFQKYISFKNIPIMNRLLAWLQFNIAKKRNTQIEFGNGENKALEFFNIIAYQYNNKTGTYLRVNNKRKENTRELFDLGVFLEEYYHSLYNEYLSTIGEPPKEEYPSNPTSEYELLDEREEFLEDDDFLQHQMDPDDFKAYIRNR